MVALGGRDARGTWDQLEIVMSQWRAIEQLTDRPGRTAPRFATFPGSSATASPPGATPPATAVTVATFLTNYLVSVWFTWLPYDDDFLLNPRYVVTIVIALISGLVPAVAAVLAIAQGSPDELVARCGEDEGRRVLPAGDSDAVPPARAVAT